MDRKFGVGILIISFCCSNLDFVYATQVLDVAPVIVQPVSTQFLEQQGLDQDRRNRDEEIEIKGLVDENKALIQDVLAVKQDTGLGRINQSMIDYEDALYSRDQARILVNGQKVSARYASLVALTEDADAMTEDRAVLAGKDALLSQKYQMLSELKGEMLALNDKLKDQESAVVDHKNKVIDAYKELVKDQQSKIQLLVIRLNQMDKKIFQFDAIIAQKDRQIELLTGDLSVARSNAASKDETIKDQQVQIVSLRQQAQDLSASEKQITTRIDQMASRGQQDKDRSATVETLQSQIALLKSEINSQLENLKSKDDILKEQGEQIAILLKNNKQNPFPSTVNTVTIPPIIVSAPGVRAKDETIDQKDGIIKTQADQLARASQQLKEQNAQFALVQDEISGLRNRLQKEDQDLQAKNDSLRWLNQVLDASKSKAEYYKLTSDKDRSSLHEVQSEIALIKGDFERQLKEFGRFDSTVVGLKAQAGQLKQQLSDKQDQLDLLKSELENKITEESDQSRQEAKIEQDLKDQLQAKEEQISKLQGNIQAIEADQANKESVLQNATAEAQGRIKLAKQLINLQEEESVLLNEKNSLVSVEGNTFEQRAHGLQDLIAKVLAAHRNHILDLRNHLDRLKDELSRKEDQVGSLNSALQDKIAELKDQTVLDYEISDLKNQIDHLNDQVQDKETQISILENQVRSGQESQSQLAVLREQLVDQQNNVDILKQELSIKAGQYDRATSALSDYKAAQEKNQGELVGQVQDLKSKLQDSINMIANLRAQLSSGLQTEDQENTIKQEMAGQESKLNMLESALKVKIQEEKNQKVLEYQIADLKSQLQDKDNQITQIRARLEKGQESEVLADSLREDLSDEQNKELLLKRELESKTAESDQMTLMISDYQKKLEAKDSSNNDELRQVLAAKNDQAAKEAQIADLNARLQVKESEIVKIKRDMYDLQEQMSTRDRDIQARDLNLSMTQQKLTDEKLQEYKDKVDGLQAMDKSQTQMIADLKAELDQDRQKLGNVPSSDEMEYLKSGLKKAADQIQQKDAMLAQVKANADEYAREFKAQSLEFRSVKAQLQDALSEIDHKKDDLKYKDMELARFKGLSKAKEADLQSRLGALNAKLDEAYRKLNGGHHENEVVVLKAQLKDANARVKDLQDKLDQLNASFKTDRLRLKLKQALDMIDQQGRYINELVAKLHEAGKAEGLVEIPPSH